MSDEAAFAAAVAASPDDDLPRLVFADWLDDQGEAERAEFVRAQVQCAATPAWEPFAVYCRHRRPEWTTGDPWRATLPWVQGWAVEWHPDRAFRRGFGHSLLIRDMTAFLADAPRLFDAAPIGELHLPTATLDQWRAFGRAKWLPRVKSVHFYGTTTPIEPVRVLCESPLATGIEEIVFEVCSRPGMPVLLEGLFESELGRKLKSLELRNGPHDPDDVYVALRRDSCEASLESLSMSQFRRPSEGNSWVYEASIFQNLTEMSLSTFPGAEPPWMFRLNEHLRSFRCRDSLWGFTDSWFAETPEIAELDLSRNPLGGWFSDERSKRLKCFSSLRSLSLRSTALESNVLYYWLPRAMFWPNLTELDLRGNRITDAGAKHLLAAPVPPDLTALLLGGNPISDDMRTKLRRHFGPAVLFDE